MRKWYKIKFTLGSTYAEILVYAHNEEEAKKLAEMQAKYSYKSRAKFTIVSIGSEEGDSNSLTKQLEKYRVKKS